MFKKNRKLDYGSSSNTPSTQVFLSSGSNPPWIIANRFCSAGLACAAMHLSNQRIERNIASSTLGPNNNHKTLPFYHGLPKHS